MHMTTNIREVADVTIVDISGRIVLGDESAALRDLVRHMLSVGHKKILFNLANVNHIDSAGLGHLVGAFTSVQKQAGELKLLGLTNKIAPSSKLSTTRPWPLILSVNRQGQRDER